MTVRRRLSLAIRAVSPILLGVLLLAGAVVGSSVAAGAVQAKGFPLLISFDGAGRAAKQCLPQADCASAATQAAWHREWNVPFDGYQGALAPPVQLDYFTAQSKWKRRYGPCNESYRNQTVGRFDHYGLENVKGQLVIEADLPLTEGQGQSPPTTTNPGCIGVEVSSPAGSSPAITKLLFPQASFGPYADWTRSPFRTNRIVTDSYSGISSAAATAGTGRWDFGGAISACTGWVRQQWLDTETVGWINLVSWLLAVFGNLGNAHLPDTLSPAGGTLNGQIVILPGTRATSSSGSVDSTPVLLATLTQRFVNRKPTLLKPVFNARGRAILAQATRPLTFRATFTFAPAHGKATTRTFVFRAKPVPPSPSSPVVSSAQITSVLVGGTPAAPTFIVHGKNLGAKPPPDPGVHPSGHNGCPTVSGDSGYDYGTSLYVVVPARNWSGGRSVGSETDCIDLVVTRFDSREVAFHFGPFYAQHRAQFPLVDGDVLQATINGATLDVHVRHGNAVTS